MKNLTDNNKPKNSKDSKEEAKASIKNSLD